MAGEALVDFSDVILRATSTSAESFGGFKAARVGGAAPTATVAGRWTSLFQYDGQPGGFGTTAPTTAAVCTNATGGSVRQAAPAAGARKRLVSIALAALVAGTVGVHDRLSHQGGLSGTATTAQTTNLPTAALTRYTSGTGVEAWGSIYTLIGTTATTSRLSSYTDDNGVTAKVGNLVAIGGTGLREAQREFRYSLENGGKGLRAVASVTNTATTGTVGAFGITLKKQIAWLPLSGVGVGEQFNAMLRGGGPVDLGVDSDACICFDWFANTTTAPELYWHALFLEK